jgi:HSP90 family molecular chaperone
LLKTHLKQKYALGNKRIFITYIKFIAMKRKELEEIIKSAFLAEMGSDGQYADESAYSFVAEIEVEEDQKPIVEDVSDDEKEESSQKESQKNSEKEESYTEYDVVNSSKPLWLRSKDEITTEEYQEFYKTGVKCLS